jgi:hypothetical protein
VTDTVVRAHQNGLRGLYQIGPTADWVYKPPQAIGQIGAGLPATAKVVDWNLFKTIRLDSSMAPSLVVGEITSRTPPPGSTLVVAVNGRIGGASGFYSAKDGRPPVAFSVLVPDFLFKAGPGQPQIQPFLATRKADGGYQLQPVTISG